ncbi:hypothetical protein V2J09_016819 [Rumex salicifolius]
MDVSKNIIRVTLWDDFVEMCRPLLRATSNSKIVIVTQFGRIGVWNNEPTLSNSYYGTRIFLDDYGIPEISDFKERLSKEEGIHSGDVIQLTADQSTSPSEIFLSEKNLRMTLDELHDHLHQNQTKNKAVILATIEHLDTPNGWYYISCRKDKTKLTDMWCRKCEKTIEYPVPRFIFQLNVINGSGTAKFIIFDKEVTSFLNKTVEDILDSRDKEEDDNNIPDDLNMLLEDTTNDISLIEKFEQLSFKDSEENMPSSFQEGSDIISKGSSSMVTPCKRGYTSMDKEENLDCEAFSHSTTRKKVVVKKEKESE